VKLIKNVGHVFCQIFNRDVFGWFILFPPATYDFNNSLSLNASTSKAAKIAVVLEHCSRICKLFIDRSFRTSILSFSALHKFINGFSFFPRNSGRAHGIATQLENHCYSSILNSSFCAYSAIVDNFISFFYLEKQYIPQYYH